MNEIIENVPSPYLSRYFNTSVKGTYLENEWRNLCNYSNKFEPKLDFINLNNYLMGELKSLHVVYLNITNDKWRVKCIGVDLSRLDESEWLSDGKRVKRLYLKSGYIKSMDVKEVDYHIKYGFSRVLVNVPEGDLDKLKTSLAMTLNLMEF